MSPVLITALIVLSSLLTVGAVVPYLIAVMKRTTKPRIVTWFTWTVLTGVSAAASFSDQQYPSGILLTLAGLATLSVVAAGWRYGDKHMAALDGICLSGAMVGLVLWQLFNNPGIAIIAAIVIDLIGGVPTWVHIWKKPKEETGITFVLSAVGAFCTLLVTHDWKITAIAYPLYLTTVNVGMAFLIYAGRRRKVSHE